jgi:hypothetical protein
LPRPVTYPSDVFELPRSARLAAWGTAALRGETAVVAAVRAVTGDDEPHQVEIAEREVPAIEVTPTEVSANEVSANEMALLELAELRSGTGLAELFGLLARFGVTGMRAVLPRPGDVLGLPGPPDFNRAALEAGEGVLTEPVSEGLSWGLVPRITPFGSAWEPGTLVSWQVRGVLPRRVTDVGSLAEAERELREALRAATETLAALDTGRWRDDATDRVAALRRDRLPASALPPTAPQRSAAVLATALRVGAIVELAAEDDGGAVSLHEAQARRSALHGLDAVCRRAVTAAVNALLEPAPPPPLS